MVFYIDNLNSKWSHRFVYTMFATTYVSYDLRYWLYEHRLNHNCDLGNKLKSNYVIETISSVFDPQKIYFFKYCLSLLK